MKKAVVWYILIAIIVLLVAFNRKEITAYVAKTWMESVKEDIPDMLHFRYTSVDSLYEIKPYMYFLFIGKNADENKDSLYLSSQRMDSLLVLTCHSIPDELKQTDTDILYLPLSAFDFLVDENNSIQLYKVVNVRKNTAGNLYQLHKMLNAQR